MLRIAAAENHHTQLAFITQHRQRYRADQLGLRQQQQQLGAIKAAKKVLLVTQTLNTQRFKRRTRQGKVSEIGRCADFPAFGKQADIGAGQTETARPTLQAVEHILQAVGGGQIGLQMQQAGKQRFVGAGLLHQ
ncbi:hypothetical protein D3C78_985030 [compost metagenome]